MDIEARAKISDLFSAPSNLLTVAVDKNIPEDFNTSSNQNFCAQNETQNMEKLLSNDINDQSIESPSTAELQDNPSSSSDHLSMSNPQSSDKHFKCNYPDNIT